MIDEPRRRRPTDSNVITAEQFAISQGPGHPKHPDFEGPPWPHEVATARKKAATAERLAASFKVDRMPDKDFQYAARPRLWGDHLYRGFLSVLNAPGGTGKSTYTLAMAVSMAIGRDLLETAAGYDTPQRRVLVINNEDPLEEMFLRVRAIAIAHALTDQELELLDANLLLKSGYEKRILFGKSGSEHDSGLTLGPDIVAIGLYCGRQEVDAVFLDPLVSIHDAEENSNTALDQLIGILRTFAKGAGVGIYLIHHSRKGAVAGAPDENARGASAIINGARVSYGLAHMSEKDAKQFTFSEAGARHRYIRLDSGKRNFSKRAVDAQWFEMISTPVNAIDEDGEPCEEFVGVPVSAELTAAMAETSEAWTVARVVHLIDNAKIQWPITLKGATLDALSAVLSEPGKADIGAEAIKKRFKGFPAEGPEAVMTIAGEPCRVFYTQHAVTEPKVYHKEMGAERTPEQAAARMQDRTEYIERKAAERAQKTAAAEVALAATPEAAAKAAAKAKDAERKRKARAAEAKRKAKAKAQREAEWARKREAKEAEKAAKAAERERKKAEKEKAVGTSVKAANTDVPTQ